MRDVDNTKEQLINEVGELRHRLVELEASGAEHKRAEDALRESEEKYRRLVNTINDLVFTLDLEGNILFANSSAREFTGYEPEETIGHNFIEYILPDDVPELLASIKQVFTEKPIEEGIKGIDLDAEYRMVKQNGEVIWVASRSHPIRDAQGKIIGFSGVTRDISEHKRAEEALKEREARLKAIFEAAGNVSFITTDLAGTEARILDFSPGAERIFGYSREEAIGKPVAMLHLPEDVARFPEMIEANRQRKEGFTGETTLVRKSGEKFPALLTTYPLFDGEGNMTASLGVSIDISEHRRLEEELLWSQKMETVGRLAGGVAHELNNLLAVILLNAELTMMGLPSNSPVRSYVEAIIRNADFGSKVVGKLLTFSRHQVLKPQVINLNHVLLEMDKILRPLISENIKLLTLPGENLGRIKIDRSQAEQVLVNLVLNARDAMPEGGEVTVETKNVTVDEEGARQIPDITPGQYVMLAISDTGIGMTDEVKAHLFEPFYTTKEVGKGTGLGLATCYGIAKHNGGSIQAYSESGKGTTFKIYLPRLEEEVEAPSRRDEPEALLGGTETVFLVEDNASVRAAVAHMLREQGYTVLDAGCGEECLRVVQENGEKKIHLLLTDVVMPRMGGRELAEKIRDIHPDVKTIFFSGYPGEALARDGMLDRDIVFLPKPFSMPVLVGTVREVLDG